MPINDQNIYLEIREILKRHFPPPMGSPPPIWWPPLEDLRAEFPGFFEESDKKLASVDKKVTKKLARIWPPKFSPAPENKPGKLWPPDSQEFIDKLWHVFADKVSWLMCEAAKLLVDNKIAEINEKIEEENPGASRKDIKILQLSWDKIADKWGVNLGNAMKRKNRPWIMHLADYFKLLHSLKLDATIIARPSAEQTEKAYEFAMNWTLAVIGADKNINPGQVNEFRELAACFENPDLKHRLESLGKRLGPASLSARQLEKCLQDLRDRRLAARISYLWKRYQNAVQAHRDAYDLLLIAINLGSIC